MDETKTGEVIMLAINSMRIDLLSRELSEQRPWQEKMLVVVEPERG